MNALEKFYDSSAKTMDMIADALLNGRQYVEGNGILSRMLGFIQRQGVKVMENKFRLRNFKVAAGPEALALPILQTD